MERRRKRLAPADLAREQGFRVWSEKNGFIVDREPVDFSVWKYLAQVYETIPRELAATDPKTLELTRGFDITIMKGAQSGGSIIFLLLPIWISLLGRYQIAYFLPTADKSIEFSTNRFIRLCRDNAAIHRLMGDPNTPHVGRRIVDEGSASIRRIVYSIIYFSYIYGTVTTESTPLDAVIFDEVQEMLPADVEKAMERVSASPLKLSGKVSTANFPGADIDYFYQRSDQREFHTRCCCSNGVVLSECWHPNDGPSCIGEGNGTTPGIPRGYFYRCPRCESVIADPQEGVFRAHNPTSQKIGFHWPQMLSPRITAAEIMEKWLNRIDTKNFYNRALGLSYTDPNTQPITDEILQAAESKGKAQQLRWGPPAPGQYPGGVYMGIDQMGGDNRVVIAAQTETRLRYLHLEIIKSDDPFARCDQLMRQYRVRHCVVENLPNYNDAFRFAKRWNNGGQVRVFVGQYQDLENEALAWGDRPRDNVKIRKTSEEEKLRYTVTLDQYKIMSAALGMWVNGEVETPDSRALVQETVTTRGREQVMVCKMFWDHLKHVALVTEYREGKEDERRLRRAVKKVGIDPHFAYSNMLMYVARARAYGTEQILLPPIESAEGRAPLEERETHKQPPTLDATAKLKDTRPLPGASVIGAESEKPLPRPAPGASFPPLAPTPSESPQRTAARREGRAYTGQLKAALPHMFNDDMPMIVSAGAVTESRAKADLVCGTCGNFDSQRNYCTLRDLYTAAKEPLCDFYEPTRGDDQEWE